MSFKLILFAFAPAFSILGCQARKFNSAPLTSTSTKATQGSVYPGFSGEADWRKEIKDENPVSVQPPRDYTQDIGVTVGVAEHFKKISGRLVNPPMKFAAKTVLETMRRIRYFTFAKNILSGQDLKPTNFDYKSMNFDKSFDISGLVGMDNPTGKTWNLLEGYKNSLSKPSLPDSNGGNWNESWVVHFGDKLFGTLVGTEASHWSDLQIHFYAATGHARHACYTDVFRSSARSILTPTIGKFDWFKGEDFPGENETTAKNLRQAAIDICSWGRLISDEAKTAMGGGRPGSKLADIEASAPQFAWLYHSLWIDNKGEFLDYTNRPITKEDAKTKELVNMFDYVMLAQTFAFDDAQQQQVINAFYGDHKLAHENKDIEINNQSDCEYWRPIRGNETFETVGSGTRCKTGDRETLLGSKSY